MPLLCYIRKNTAWAILTRVDTSSAAVNSNHGSSDILPRARNPISIHPKYAYHITATQTFLVLALCCRSVKHGLHFPYPVSTAEGMYVPTFTSPELERADSGGRQERSEEEVVAGADHRDFVLLLVDLARCFDRTCEQYIAVVLAGLGWHQKCRGTDAVLCVCANMCLIVSRTPKVCGVWCVCRREPPRPQSARSSTNQLKARNDCWVERGLLSTHVCV